MRMRLDSLRNFVTRTGAGPLFALASMALYITVQNFFKWYPFADGRNAQHLPTLQENIVSVIASLVVYFFVGLSLFSSVCREFKWTKIDSVAAAFCSFLIVQFAFRDLKAEELARSLALVGSMTSAIFIGRYFGRTPERLHILLKTVRSALVVSIIAGFIVAVIKPRSVEWGSFTGFQCAGSFFCRAELFFFAINPVIVVLLLWRNRSFSNANGFSKYAQISFGFFISFLALLTRTRQYVLSILAGGVIAFVLWLRPRRKVTFAVLAVLFFCGLVFGPKLLQVVLEYVRVVPETGSTANTEALDWTNGRRPLLEFLYQLFMKAPLIGHGGAATRLLIRQENFTATTEHGFLFYPAAYGVFGFLFIAYILTAFLRGAKVVIQALRGEISAFSPRVTLALIVVPLFPFGFFGLFGSATNPTDWFSLVIASLVLTSHERTKNFPADNMEPSV